MIHYGRSCDDGADPAGPAMRRGTALVLQLETLVLKLWTHWGTMMPHHRGNPLSEPRLVPPTEHTTALPTGPLGL